MMIGHCYFGCDSVNIRIIDSRCDQSSHSNANLCMCVELLFFWVAKFLGIPVYRLLVPANDTEGSATNFLVDIVRVVTATICHVSSLSRQTFSVVTDSFMGAEYVKNFCFGFRYCSTAQAQSMTDTPFK